jgi:hypothetical protein
MDLLAERFELLRQLLRRLFQLALRGGRLIAQAVLDLSLVGGASRRQLHQVAQRLALKIAIGAPAGTSLAVGSDRRLCVELFGALGHR